MEVRYWVTAFIALTLAFLILLMLGVVLLIELHSLGNVVCVRTG
jgi:hypothetical protein